MAGKYYMEHIAFFICQQEGSLSYQGGQWVANYGLIEYGQTPHGLSLIQWTFNRSFTLLRNCYIRNGRTFGGTTPPADIKSAIENNNPWSDYFWYTGTPAREWVVKFLNLPKSKLAVNELLIHDLKADNDNLKAKGVTDDRARAFCSDFVNQYGIGSIQNGIGLENIDNAYNTCPKTYQPRRRNAWEYFKNCDFDKKPAFMFETEPNPDPEPTPKPPSTGEKDPDENAKPHTKDPVVVFQKALEKMFSDFYFINNNQQYLNGFIKLEKQLNNMYKMKPVFDISEVTLDWLNNFIGNVVDDGNKDPEPTPDPDPPEEPDKTGYYWPFYNNNKIIFTSPYGYRDPSIGSGAFHQGIDIVDAGGSGTTIYAIHSGTVIVSSDYVPGWGSAGSMILIKNDTDDWITTYEEFKPGSQRVKVGDKVKGGQAIATNGISGNATGEHLHLGINKYGITKPARPEYWVSPAPFLNIKNATGTYSRPAKINASGV